MTRVKKKGIPILLYFLATTLLLVSCKEETKKTKEWRLDHEIHISENLTPFGIANYKRGVFISDTTQDRVIMIDTFAFSFYDDVSITDPGYINTSINRCYIPSLTLDSVYVYKGGISHIFVGEEPFDTPTAAVGYRVDSYIIVDQMNNRVVRRVADDYNYIGQDVPDEYKLNMPSNMQIYGDSVIIVDSGNKRMAIYDNQGHFFSSFGENENYKWPTGITMDETRYFVSDPELNIINSYTLDGEFIETLPQFYDEPNDINFFEGRLYVANRKGTNVTILKEF